MELGAVLVSVNLFPGLYMVTQSQIVYIENHFEHGHYKLFMSM